MVTKTAKQFKEEYGVTIEEALVEPVTITRHGRPTVVLMSASRYAELEAMEDAALDERARKATVNGFLGVEESSKFLMEMLNAKA
jgi:PHD/YefM family antitoxin component YafN of YafNO toxin-antitoxin module